MNVVKILVLTFLFAKSVAATQTWQLVNQDSTLSFIASYDEIPFDGKFEHFEIDLKFDPNNLSSSLLKTHIDVTSVNTNSRDRDDALKDPSWFHFKKFPQATFTSSRFTKLNEDAYQVTGVLTIRDQQREISFPFQWQPESNNRVRVSAEFNLDRRDFNIGNGEWATDATIGFSVAVKIILLLETTL